MMGDFGVEETCGGSRKILESKRQEGRRLIKKTCGRSRRRLGVSDVWKVKEMV